MTVSAEAPSTRLLAKQRVRLFLCGDVMTGRGIDQVLAHPCKPHLYEGYVGSASDYVALAERANGPIPRHVDDSYVWGVALTELNRMQPDARIINLETSVTRSEDYAPKGINYRMSPENAGCLVAAGIDCCGLANNHILDWGRTGLLDTLSTLDRLRIKTAGAGRNLDQAKAPAVLDIADKCRVLVFSLASATSGTSRSWAAEPQSPGVNFLRNLSDAMANRLAEEITHVRQPHDIVVLSLHWGGNWGYEIGEEQRHFAHALIDLADVSIIHGHSSHHARAMEVYRNRLILYGCGDFLNDYEGITGHDDYRDDLALMYFADVDLATRDLAALVLVPLQIRQFRLVRPFGQDIEWLQATLDRECRKFGARVLRAADQGFVLSWTKASKSPTLIRNQGSIG
ncbi:MAG TPA: CapA family protein [Xanthobacteraceae bacterium]|nr:CapA family protein [Xanthobacteraceae bacterium]